jgi:uncharacterized protein
VATDTYTTVGEGADAPQKTIIIDTDVHAQANPAELAKYMPKRWAEHVWGLRHGFVLADLVRVRANAARTDTWPKRGGLPGSDPELIAEQLLDRYDLTYAIADMIGVGTSGTGPRGFTEAFCRANNEWYAEQLLARDPRWLCSMNIPYEFGGESVVKELEHWANEKRFVQVVLSMRTEKPLGDPKYWPMYEACEAIGMPVAIHPALGGGNQVTGSGWPSYYYEDHVGYPQANAVHAASMICEGVFDRFPKLKFVVVEGGWSWSAPLCWRLDSTWRVLRDEVPDLQRMPSEYIREHFWYTTQPIEEPERLSLLPEVLERSGVQDRLMFSSDYPHWDFDSPTDAIPDTIPEETRNKIFHENAMNLYGLSVDGLED